MRKTFKVLSGPDEEYLSGSLSKVRKTFKVCLDPDEEYLSGFGEKLEKLLQSYLIWMRNFFPVTEKSLEKVLVHSYCLLVVFLNFT